MWQRHTQANDSEHLAKTFRIHVKSWFIISAEDINFFWFQWIKNKLEIHCHYDSWMWVNISAQSGQEWLQVTPMVSSMGPHSWPGSLSSAHLWAAFIAWPWHLPFCFHLALWASGHWLQTEPKFTRRDLSGWKGQSSLLSYSQQRVHAFWGFWRHMDPSLSLSIGLYRECKTNTGTHPVTTYKHG